jgi:flagellar hook protein FlgE
MYSIFDDGTRIASYKIPLATVPSPDNLSPEVGNVYSISTNSGNIQVDFAGNSGLGTIKPEALEASNVDLANELTAMIESQRSYTANSKVFQTGADLLDVLVNLKR